MLRPADELQHLIENSEEDKRNWQYYPTIFVGCGGTGAKVFERIRRQTLERFGSLGPEGLPGVAYLSIDTDTGSKHAGHQQPPGTAGDRVLIPTERDYPSQRCSVGHQWYLVSARTWSRLFSMWSHRDSITFMSSARVRKVRFATPSLMIGQSRSAGCSSGE